VETIFDTYSAIVYGVAFCILNDQKKAEQILIEVFKVAFREDLIESNRNSICSMLIKLTITKSKAIKPVLSNFEQVLFADAPAIQKVFFGNVPLEEKARRALRLKVRSELKSIDASQPV
jgi:hypothetical protein